MHKLATIAALAVMLVWINACVITVNTDDEYDGWSSRQERNERTIKRLDLGRTLDSIENELGEPDFVESFHRNDDTFKVLYYRTHRRHGDGRTTKDETTPLVFVDGVLVGWGESAIEFATK